MQRNIVRVIAIIFAVLFVVSIAMPVFAIKEANGYSSVSSQLEELYNKIGTELGIDYIYIKILHILAGGRAVYADKNPNIYNESTVEDFRPPFQIDGANIKLINAPWAECPDSSIQRPSAYYVPDAAYSVSAGIVNTMRRRNASNREEMARYYSKLPDSVKTTILFCEALLEYLGNGAADNYYRVYEKVLMDKESDLNVIEVKDGIPKIKDEYLEVFKANGIVDETSLNALAIVYSFDIRMSDKGYKYPGESEPSSSSIDNLPYKVGVTSRENMMKAAFSLVGKARYIWGGGHGGAFQGIKSRWQQFHDMYSKTPGGPGYRMCIKPGESWCPIHGKIVKKSSSDFRDYGEILDIIGDNTQGAMEGVQQSSSPVIEVTPTPKATEQAQVQPSSTYVPKATLSPEEIAAREAILSNTRACEAAGHGGDGFDCSGYACWLYGNINSEQKYSSNAKSFNKHDNMVTIPLGEKILPGDIMNWATHIIVNVGTWPGTEDVYLIIEQAPPQVKFGVAYIDTASQENIEACTRFARELNVLYGDVEYNGRFNKFNLTKLGYGRDNPGDRDWDGVTYGEVGRLGYRYIDENLILPGLNKRFIDLDAVTMMQYITDNMPTEYLSGLATYKSREYTGINVDGRAPIQAQEEVEGATGEGADKQ